MTTFIVNENKTITIGNMGKVKIIEFNVESLNSLRSPATFFITKNSAVFGFTVEATGTEVNDKPKASKFLLSRLFKPFSRISVLTWLKL